ncbi:MAG TPA: DUF1800 domain-containing protein [Terracidiphilus sp.]|nr:DUF1800 domain-containing protein [Terracidiphilus sp.]
MQLLQRSLAAFLCLSLTAPPVSGWSQTASDGGKPAAAGAKPRAPYQSGQLRGDERILHAMNRFTFGPRPGDLDVVRSIGLDNWFEQQLHPASLDLSDLNARLAEFPAMQWNPEDLLFRVPSNAIIRQVIDGKAPVPDRGVLHAIYEDQIYRVTEKKQEQAQKKEAELNKAAPVAIPAAPSMNPGMAMDGKAEPAESPTPLSKDPNANQANSSEAGQINMSASQPANAGPVYDATFVDPFVALPAQQRIAKLIAMQPSEIESFLKGLRPIQRAALEAGLTPQQREVVSALENPERLVVEELTAQRLTRDIYSTAQLQEVMTDFWMNHFNVYLRKNEATPYYLVSYERDVIRPLALGKFEDLLEATAHSPAMLLYLDNSESIGPDSPAAERAQIAAARRPGNPKKVRQGLNENYARELMELHTVGVNGGYTQADVTQVARILTGWTVERPQRGGGFEFDPNRHEPGTKKALGQKFKDHGEMEGRELLHFLATRPATAQFLSRKLAVRFVSDDPPQALIDRMAKTYLSSGGDISAVLRTLYHSPEFWSTTVYRAKVKTPIEFVVSAVRASDAQIDNLRPIANELRTLGMPLYGCVPPTGYNWQSSAWVSTGALVDRMNFSLSLAANRLPGITASWSPQVDNTASSMLATDGPSAESEESRLESLIVAGGVSDSTRSAVMQQFQQQAAQNTQVASTQPIAAQARAAFRAQGPSPLERQDQLLAGLLLGSPEFQRR